MPGRRRTLIALAATVVVLAPLLFLWQRSLLPSSMSATEMGYIDTGGGPAMPPGHHHDGQSVADLTGPRNRTPDVRVELVARKERFELPGVGKVDGYMLNHRSPGPEIKVRQGQLAERLGSASAAAEPPWWSGRRVPPHLRRPTPAT